MNKNFQLSLLRSTTPWRRRTKSDVLSWVPDACQFCVNPSTGRRKLIVLSPSCNTWSLTGGAIMILQLAAEAARRGADVLIMALYAVPKSQEDFTSGLRANLQVEPEIANKIQVVDARQGYVLNLGDKIMATASWTLPLAVNLAKRCGHSKPAYLIQDVEPCFFPFGSNHASLMLTYYENYLPIATSHNLAQMICNLGIGSYTTDNFIKSWLILDTCIDRQIFYPTKPRDGKKRIFIYHRTGLGEQRNLSVLALESISRMAFEGLLNPDDWEIRCFGDPSAIPYTFTNGLRTEILNISMEEYATEIRSASLGIVFLLSPQAGTMVFELAASGVPVITNTYLNKTSTYLRSVSPYVYPVEPTYDAVSSQLRMMLIDGIYRGGNIDPDIYPIVNMPCTWRESFNPIMDRFMEWYEE